MPAKHIKRVYCHLCATKFNIIQHIFDLENGLSRVCMCCCLRCLYELKYVLPLLKVAWLEVFFIHSICILIGYWVFISFILYLVRETIHYSDNKRLFKLPILIFYNIENHCNDYRMIIVRLILLAAARYCWTYWTFWSLWKERFSLVSISAW